MVIWKYVMNTPYINFKMPRGAQILSCQMQHDYPTIWALVDEGAPKELRCFVAIETGQVINTPIARMKFVATILTAKGTVAHHIFET